MERIFSATYFAGAGHSPGGNGSVFDDSAPHLDSMSGYSNGGWAIPPRFFRVVELVVLSTGN